MLVKRQNKTKKNKTKNKTKKSNQKQSENSFLYCFNDRKRIKEFLKKKEQPL